VGASGEANAHHFSGCPNILRSFFVSAWSMCRLPAFPVAIRHVDLRLQAVTIDIA